jgi:hypothetical protein
METLVGENVISIDDQPMDASFFGTARRLTDFITPDALEVETLFKQITKGISESVDRIKACGRWVSSQIRYVEFVSGKLWINGKTSVQSDLWTLPEVTIHTRIGNCAVKSLLLASLLRNELAPDQVFCTLGNLYNGIAGGHAWVTVKLMEENIMETTIPNGPPMVPASTVTRYEPVHHFNDLQVLAVEGKTQMIPMTACYSSWLEDYLNWGYIESQKHS